MKRVLGKRGLLPKGYYLAVLKNARSALTKQAVERWSLDWEILEGEFKGQVVQDFILDLDSFARKSDSLFRALYPEKDGTGEEIEIEDPASEIGKKAKLSIGVVEGNPDYDEPPEINRVFSYSALSKEEAGKLPVTEAEEESI
jgi:hypothetical protein